MPCNVPLCGERTDGGPGTTTTSGQVIVTNFPTAFSVKESPADVIAIALPGGLLQPNTPVVLSGTPPAGYSHRRAFIVSNLDPGNNIFIRDGAGVLADVVGPLTTHRPDISGPVSVVNTSGAAIGAAISEIWYRS